MMSSQYSRGVVENIINNLMLNFTLVHSHSLTLTHSHSLKVTAPQHVTNVTLFQVWAAQPVQTQVHKSLLYEWSSVYILQFFSDDAQAQQPGIYYMWTPDKVTAKLRGKAQRFMLPAHDEQEYAIYNRETPFGSVASDWPTVDIQKLSSNRLVEVQ